MAASIEIIGTESLGVCGVCYLIKTAKRRIVIDPGLALGYIRHGLLPHPLQVAEGERVRRRQRTLCSVISMVIIFLSGSPIRISWQFGISLETCRKYAVGVRPLIL